MKKTAWFPGTVKPVRPGVYQTRCGFGDIIGYQRWNGRYWFYWARDARTAAMSSQPCHHLRQNDPWRGLTTKDGK